MLIFENLSIFIILKYLLINKNFFYKKKKIFYIYEDKCYDPLHQETT
jgi:hypothetical protein